jgi:hypothetical protein
MLLIIKWVGAMLPTRYGKTHLFRFRREIVKRRGDWKCARINAIGYVLPRKYGRDSLAGGVFTVPDWQPVG